MKTLDEVTARDLMQPRVVTLRDSAPIEEALATFEDERISGAPVVDASDRPVGVLSAFDVAQTRHMQRARITGESGEHDYGFYEETGEDFDAGAFSGKEDYSPTLLGKETVADWMTPRVISVEPDRGMRDVCRLMTHEGIHRVLVMQDGRLEGIVSTSDIVRAIGAMT